ncbi:hypothetical protein BJY04DRAFT_149227 [Aspergillus karnatakaensis]|uniref:uncharacterized protein n=1 Tax=Aspergillus karnatakaensis TaxID=1810916 RepID=UPI003CCDB148
MKRFETHKELFEFEANFTINHEALRFYKQYDEAVKRQKDTDELAKKEQEATTKAREESRLRRSVSLNLTLPLLNLDENLNWVNPPLWQERYEEVSNARIVVQGNGFYAKKHTSHGARATSRYSRSKGNLVSEKARFAPSS